MKNRIPLLLSATLFSFQQLGAQGYPMEDYDDSPYGEIQRPRPRDTAVPGQSPASGPRRGEGPRSVARQKPRKRSVTRVSLKASFNYSSYEQDSISPSLSGMGFGVFGGLGWDLVGNPVYIEFEGGYQRLLHGENIHFDMASLGLSVHYRVIMARNMYFKPGIRSAGTWVLPGTDLNIETAQQIVPTLALTALLDLGGFLLEPMATLYYVSSGNRFYDLSVRAGYRF